MDDLTGLGLGTSGLIPLTTAVTAFIMKVSADWFNKEKYAPWVSLASGVIASVIWQLFNPNIPWAYAIGRGVLIGFGGSALWDYFKSTKAIKNGD